MTADLSWLPPCPDFKAALQQLKALAGSTNEKWQAAKLLAGHRLDLLETGKLDHYVEALKSASSPEPFRVALLAGSTIDHLMPALRIAALRRGLVIECFVGPFNQFQQPLFDASSDLWTFNPKIIVLLPEFFEGALSADFSAGPAAGEWIEDTVTNLESLWSAASGRGVTVIQQNAAIPPLQFLGHLDAAVASTPVSRLRCLNEALAARAAANQVLLFDAEQLAASIGTETWFDWPLWHHAKQTVSPALAVSWGDSLARQIVAVRGLSKKCLALDLDNTLWGGVIGDDGLEGIELGSGTGVGEAYQAFQRYLKQLKARGVILAVCSKNDPANARLPFEKHPEMVLRLEDISCFVANWNDKAANLRHIADTLKIGLDAIVFFDDNPFERNLVRELAPVVSVPEVPEDPALFPLCLSKAGFFEATSFTTDDAARSTQYAANQQREQAKGAATDVGGYLKSLSMEMIVTPFDDVGRARIAQLINKSNQFNLTTRRYTEAEVRQMQQTPDWLTFQARLTDKFGDNGMISVVILAPILNAQSQTGYRIDTWLMSCRVLGREVEEALLNVIVDQARARGANFLWGQYVPTAKNDLVRNHYGRLGFSPLPAAPSAEGTWWALETRTYSPKPTAIRVVSPERTAL